MTIPERFFRAGSRRRLRAYFERLYISPITGYIFDFFTKIVAEYETGTPSPTHGNNPHFLIFFLHFSSFLLVFLSQRGYK